MRYTRASQLGDTRDFHDADLDNVDWPTPDGERSFVDCRFNGVNFGSSALTSLSFTRCDFGDCRFNSVEASELIFHRCNFYDAASEQGTPFRFATLRACEFRECDLTLTD